MAPASVGGAPGVDTYLDLFEHNVKVLAATLR